MVLKRERACGSYILGNEEAVGLHSFVSMHKRRSWRLEIMPVLYSKAGSPKRI